MKILHVITRFVRGGADENTLLSCNAQATAGHDVVLIHGSATSQHLLAQVHPDVLIEMAPNLVREIDPLRDVKALLELTRMIGRHRPDIVHTHTSKAGILGRAAAVTAGCPGIVHGVHILPFLNVGPAARLVYLSLEHGLAPATKAFVNVSVGMKEECLRVNLGAGRHHVVPSGMDIERFRSAKPVADETLADVFGISPAAAISAELVLMAAALEPRKRVLPFMDVFKEVAAHRPRALLAISGEGPEREAIVARAEALGLSDRVRLLGFRTDVERWMKRADVCTLSSEREGLPRVIVQYVLAGRPVVSTALPGVEQVVRDGVTGYLTPTDDLSIMAGAIAGILNDKSVGARMAQDASAMDLSPWSVESMADQLEEIYQAILAPADRRHA